MADRTPGSDGLQQAVADICGALGRGRIVDIAALPGGVMNFNFRVELSSGEWLLARIYPPGREHVVEYEPDVLRRCARALIPVPEVLADSRAYRVPSVPHAWMVYRWLHGTPLSARWPLLGDAQRSVLASELACQLARLGSLGVEGHGDLLDGARGTCRTWREFVATAFREGLPILQSGRIVEPELLANLSMVPALLAKMSLDRPSFLGWGDVSPENLLVDDSGNLAGMVDFESAMAGDRALTLGYFYARFGDTDLFNRVLVEWPRVCEPLDQTRIDLCAVVRLLRIAPHSRGPLPTGLPHQPLQLTFPCVASAARRLTADLLDHSIRGDEQ